MSAGKKAAAKEAVEIFKNIILEKIQNCGQVIIGVGTGTTAQIVAEYLQAYFHSQGFKRHQIIGIPTSAQAVDLIEACGMTLGSLLQYSKIDFTFDGADEVDASGQYLIKGGGAAHFQEKLIAAVSAVYYVIVDSTKINSNPSQLGHIVTYYLYCRILELL